MQNVSGIKKWNYEKLPLNFAMQFPFPFPVIPGNNNVSFPFPKCGNGISIPVPKNWEWNFPVPVPKSWEWNFSFPFPFPKFGNGLSHSRSRSQMTKSHSRSPLVPGQFRPKRDHQISDPVVSVSFWSKPLSWTTCDALWPILAFYSHFVDIFGPRVGFWGPRRTKFQNDCWGPFSCILLVCLHLKGCN